MIRSFLTRLFTDRYRKIFNFWDGRRWRRADPMVVARLYDEADGFSWDETPQMAYAGDSDALVTLANTTRHAFDLPVYDGRNGLTELELMDLTGQFVGYLFDLKKNISDSQTSPEPTEPQPSADSVTSSESAFTSTSDAPKHAAPTM